VRHVTVTVHVQPHRGRLQGRSPAPRGVPRPPAEATSRRTPSMMDAWFSASENTARLSSPGGPQHSRCCWGLNTLCPTPLVLGPISPCSTPLVLGSDPSCGAPVVLGLSLACRGPLGLGSGMP